MLHRLFTNNWVILGGSVLLATLAILRAFPETPGPIAKPQSAQKGHSERSEESRIFSDLRSFTSFRMAMESGLATASTPRAGGGREPATGQRRHG